MTNLKIGKLEAVLNLNKLYIRFARNARGSGAQRSDAPTALSVKLELPAASLPTAHSYLWPEGVNPAMPESCAPELGQGQRDFLMVIRLKAGGPPMVLHA